MVELRAKTDEEIAAWLPGMFAQYVDERVAAGEERAVAQANSDAQMAQLFPEGRPAEGQHVMHVVADGDVVGSLWMGRPFSGDQRTWYVFDIVIDEAHRGKGLGRATMLAAEAWTTEHGGTRIALNVFGHNRTARALYDSLGFEVMATAMYKDL